MAAIPEGPNMVLAVSSAIFTVLAWPLRDCSTPVIRDAREAANSSSPSMGSTMRSVVRHALLHKTKRLWSSQREQWFIDQIPDGATVLDLGAGSMHVRMALEQAGRRRISYTPADVVDRGASRMLVCHFNLHEYPLQVRAPEPTHVVLQGVLEYVYDKLLLLRALRCAYPRASLLVSYTVGHKVGQFESDGWVAPLTHANLQEMFSTLGLLVETKRVGCLPALHQDCMRLRPAPIRDLPRQMCAGFGSAGGGAGGGGHGLKESPEGTARALAETAQGRSSATSSPNRSQRVTQRMCDAMGKGGALAHRGPRAQQAVTQSAVVSGEAASSEQETAEVAEAAEEAELQAAQAAVMRLLSTSRGTSCRQSMPIFISRFGNVLNLGDEMSAEIGAALLGVHVPPASPHGRAVATQPEVHLTTSAATHPKLLLVGSVLANARSGDVVAGAGFKPSAGNFQRLSLLRNGSVRVVLVRGPRTCGALHGLWEVQGNQTNSTPLGSPDDRQQLSGKATLGPGTWPRSMACPMAVCDPAVLAHLLLPDWHGLRRAGPPPPDDATPSMDAIDGEPRPRPLLCVVPHVNDHRHVLYAVKVAVKLEQQSQRRKGQHARVVVRVVGVALNGTTPLHFMRELMPCGLVVATALHGIILADAVRIPAVWLPGKQPAAKFLDYFEGVRKPLHRVQSLSEAVQMLSEHAPLCPRFRVHELLALATSFLSRFPFDAICSPPAPAPQTM